MKTILEQKVFNFSSLFVAACLVVPTSVGIVLDDLIPGIIFSSSAILFLFFICRFNLRIHRFNGFISSFVVTYLSYTILVIIFTIAYIPFDLPFNYNAHFGIAALSLIYGYVFNIAISLVVYLLYKGIMFYKNYE